MNKFKKALFGEQKNIYTFAIVDAFQWYDHSPTKHKDRWHCHSGRISNIEKNQEFLEKEGGEEKNFCFCIFLRRKLSSL